MSIEKNGRLEVKKSFRASSQSMAEWYALSSPFTCGYLCNYLFFSHIYALLQVLHVYRGSSEITSNRSRQDTESVIKYDWVKLKN